MNSKMSKKKCITLKLKLIMVMDHLIKLIEIKILSFTIKILWEPPFLLLQQEF